jgi:hypothetical protein
MNRTQPANLFFNSPDWRWQRATYEHGKWLKGETDFPACNDSLIKGAVKFLRLWEDKTIPNDRKRSIFPYYSKLVDIYGSVYPGCTRHCIEAAAMARFPADGVDVVNQLGSEIDPLMYRIYKALFFDVDSKLESQSYFWIKKNLLMPYERLSRELRNSGYLWKEVAYEGGPEVFLQVCMAKNSEESCRGWIRDNVMKKVERRVLENSSTMSTMPPELEAMATNTVVGKWMDESRQIANLQNATDGTTVNQLGDLRHAITVHGDKTKLEKVENISSEKYTEKDLIT